MFPIVECDIHIHLPFQVGDVFRNYCEHKPNTSSEKHDWNTREKRDLTLVPLSSPVVRGKYLSCVLSLSPPCVDISVCLAGGCNILPSYWSSQAGLVTLLVCLAQLTGPVTGATLIKREITTFLASPPPTVVYLPCSLNMELQPTLKIS